MGLHVLAVKPGSNLNPAPSIKSGPEGLKVGLKIQHVCTRSCSRSSLVRRRSCIRYKHALNQGTNKKKILYLTCTKAINTHTQKPSQTYRLSVGKHQATTSQRLLINTVKVTEAENRHGYVSAPLRFHIQKSGSLPGLSSVHPGVQGGGGWCCERVIRAGSPVENTEVLVCSFREGQGLASGDQPWSDETRRPF